MGHRLLVDARTGREAAVGRKIAVVVLAVALGALGGTAAFGGNERERKAASDEAFDSEPRPPPVSLARTGNIGKEALRLPNKVNCRTLQCLNKSLSKLNKAVNNLNFVTFTCEQLMDVTQYFGYEFDNQDGSGTFLTTGLDRTEPGDTVNVRVVVDTC